MDRRAIHQLPISLVNRIAAGEVIERPASVVKELVENAIDAGATHITIETQDGGRELMRIIDDGCGIPAAELPLAFAEHATSKLATDEDLFAINTMGFRGEALASIGAVSHARILSRTAESEAAYEILNRGGALSDAQAAAGNIGTTVAIRDLFFNTPARRKFLKGAATESGHISEMVLRLALPHPQIAFKLISGGRTSLDLPAATAEQRLLAAWPDQFHEQRLPMDLRDAEIRLGGLVGLPELANPTAKYQYFYLNGRHIRDRFIQHAVKEAYRGLIEPGRYPAAILLLTVPPQDVDVNVHPTKTEVRFKDSGRIHGLILSGLRERLLGSDLAPRAMANAGDGPGRPDMRARLAEFFKQQYSQAAEGAEAGQTSPQAGSFLHSPIPGTPPLPYRRDDGEGSGFGVRGSGRSDEATERRSDERAAEGVDRGWRIEDSAGRAEADRNVRPTVDESDPQLQIANRKLQIDASASAQSQIENRKSKIPSPALQLHNAYLVAESEDGLLIIDQHALHERIMYEELRARLSRGPLESQQLLIPDVIPASPRQLAILEQIQPLLKRLGIELAAFGPDSVAIHAFPSFLHKLDPGQFVGDLLERGEQELLDLHDEELLHKVLDMMACKAAVKAGDPLSPAEIEALLARRGKLVERSSNCPHGRPTTLRLSLRDLEKQFKRTGF